MLAALNAVKPALVANETPPREAQEDNDEAREYGRGGLSFTLGGMRILAISLVAFLLIGVGVGGTLGFQRIIAGESADCEAWNDAAHRYLAYEPTEAELDTYLERTNSIMDIRYKACQM